MFSVLIAMMGETYSNFRDQSELRWKLIKAETIVQTEESWIRPLYELFRGPITNLRPPHHVIDGEILALGGNSVPNYSMVVETRLEPDEEVTRSWDAPVVKRKDNTPVVSVYRSVERVSTDPVSLKSTQNPLVTPRCVQNPL